MTIEVIETANHLTSSRLRLQLKATLLVALDDSLVVARCAPYRPEEEMIECPADNQASWFRFHAPASATLRLVSESTTEKLFKTWPCLKAGLLSWTASHRTNAISSRSEVPHRDRHQSIAVGALQTQALV